MNRKNYCKRKRTVQKNRYAEKEKNMAFDGRRKRGETDNTPHGACGVCRTAQVMRTLQFYDRQRYDEKTEGRHAAAPLFFCSQTVLMFIDFIDFID